MQQDGKTRTEESTGDTRSFSEIAGAVVRDFQAFFRAEVRLAGAEIKEKARNYAKAGSLIAIAGFFGFFAFACLVMTCIVALAIVLPLWLAALLMGVLLGGAAGGAFLLGRMAIDQIDPIPQRTLQMLRETMERVANLTK